WIGQHVDDPKYIFHAGAAEGELATLDIDADGVTTRWFVDPKTGLLVRTSAKTQTMQGPVQRVTEFSDYKPVSGLNFPFKRVTREDGQITQETTVKEVKINQ